MRTRLVLLGSAICVPVISSWSQAPMRNSSEENQGPILPLPLALTQELNELLLLVVCVVVLLPRLGEGLPVPKLRRVEPL